MSTIVEFITAIAFSLLGFSEEIPADYSNENATIECCEIEPAASLDTLQTTNISSIKIEQNKTENILL